MTAPDPAAPPTPLRKEVSASFEFFPPTSLELEEKLWLAIERLAPLAPKFVSVTYGAGGTTRERTHATVERLKSQTNLVPAAHLTCVSASKAEIHEVVERYLDAGVRHIVALRGDAQKESDTSSVDAGYPDALALVKGIKAIDPHVELSVAAYPEPHPKAASAQADLDWLKRKVDAGATRAITQFFFEADTYLEFVDRARTAGISVPIVPGILPVTNFATVSRFARQCGTSVPAWFAELFAGLDKDPKTRQLVAASTAIELCRKLQRNGVNEFHFYTLNRAELTRSICHVLGLRATEQPVSSTPAPDAPSRQTQAS